MCSELLGIVRWCKEIEIELRRRRRIYGLFIFLGVLKLRGIALVGLAKFLLIMVASGHWMACLYPAANFVFHVHEFVESRKWLSFLP